jgi:ATP-dependent exoDNAse (exonuclease V) beta subunit
MAAKLKARITFISAGAGSGKTHRLTEILHAELTGGQIRPSGVIATTFTKKAATELRERVRGHLLKKGDFGRANAMGQARIGTVNSVCGQLIARFAFEAGLAAEQQVLDEAPAASLLDKAIDTVMDGSAMGDFLGLVRRLGLDESRNDDPIPWKKDLRSLVDQIRANDIPLARVAGFAAENAQDLLSHFPKRTADDLNGSLRQVIATALPAIEAAVTKSNKQNTGKYLALLRNVNRGLAGGSLPWGEWVKLAKLSPEAGLKAEAQPIADLVARYGEHPSLHADIGAYLEKIFRLAAEALENYAKRKREQGALDFADQEHLLLTLLDNPAVSEVLEEELDLLMVDEFQDTSPIQLALFLKLARFAKRVYWVGDIKQAIYGFRGSDTELMQSILRELPKLGGTKDVLPSSWRSRAELVRLTNAVFSKAFANSLPKEEVELVAQRTDQLPGAPLSNWILSGKNVDEEATALALGVRKLVESRYQIIEKDTTVSRDVCFSDIAILSRSHAGVQRIAAALSSQGMPSATEQPGLLGTPEATLALACLRRLNDPGDTVATAEIAAMTGGIEPEVWVANRLRYLKAGGDADSWLETETAAGPVHGLIERIGELRRQLPLLAPREALQTVIAECNLSAITIAWSPDPEKARVRLANLEALLDLAAQYEDLCRSGQHAATISGLILWLDEIATEQKDTLARPAINAVKVMTHHAAKGLEWPVVVLMDLAADIRDRLWGVSVRPGNRFNVLSPLDDRFIRYWPWPFGMQKTVDLADKIAATPVAAAFRHAAVEEEKRLLYVSMTRARDHIVFARSSRKLSGEWLDSVESPWLLTDEASPTITLPDGTTQSSERWTLAAPDDLESNAAVDSPVFWFQKSDSPRIEIPLAFNPSSATGANAVVQEKVSIGQRTNVREGTDKALLGEAIHACLALSFADPERLIDTADVERLLSQFDVADSVSATAIVSQTKALHQWIRERWPDARLHAEYPVQCVLPSNQVLNGRADLLIETAKGWVLLDHKSSELAADHWDRLADDYGSQLASYEGALSRVTKREVIESWIFLPVSGGAVRIGGLNLDDVMTDWKQ